MKFEQQTGKSIEAAFSEFNSQNPKVYLLFCEQCFRAIRRNKEKISSKQILGYIRWEVSLDTHSDDGFKINDAFTSHYSRLFAKQYPEHEDLFNFRELRNGNSGVSGRSKLNAYQIEKLEQINIGFELWFINNEHKLINPENKVQYKIETRTVKKYEEHKFIKIAEQKGDGNNNDLFQIKKYEITPKGAKYLTAGMTP